MHRSKVYHTQYLCITMFHNISKPQAGWCLLHHRSSQYMGEVVTTQTQDRCPFLQSQMTRMVQCQAGRQGSAWLLCR